MADKLTAFAKGFDLFANRFKTPTARCTNASRSPPERLPVVVARFVRRKNRLDNTAPSLITAERTMEPIVTEQRLQI
jgi:hypothetical protein